MRRGGVYRVRGEGGAVVDEDAQLVSNVIAAAGSDALALYLARDTDTYRTLGTGTEVATWIDQIGAAHPTQATASKRPAMDAGNAPNGRDRLDFSRASAQMLVASAAWSRNVNDRLFMMYVAQAKTADATQQRHVSWNNTTIALTLGLQHVTGDFLQQSHDGAAENITTGAEDTAIHRHENWMASPHVGYLDNTPTNGSRTGGINGNHTLTLNIGGSRSDSNHSDMYMMFLLLGVIGTGTAVPSWAATVRGHLSTYYGGAV